MMVDRPLKREEPPLRGYRLLYTCAPEQIRRSQLELCETIAKGLSLFRNTLLTLLEVPTNTVLQDA